jgi:hypothetical protein
MAVQLTTTCVATAPRVTHNHHGGRQARPAQEQRMTHEELAGYLVTLAWHARVLGYLTLVAVVFMVVGIVAIIRDTRAIATMTAEVLRRIP